MKSSEIVAIAKKYASWYCEWAVLEQLEKMGLSEHDIDRVINELEIMTAWQSKY